MDAGSIGPGRFTASGVAAARGGRRLFDGLAFDLPPGSALVLTGANGSGKSSLLRLMAGFGRPVAGRFDWDGSDIWDDIEAHRGRLHYVGHEDALKPALTVAETLRFWLALSGRRGDVERGLAVAGLASYAALPCRMLSAGQRRRLALARPATWEAPLWLLDEPTVGLDAESLENQQEQWLAHLAAGGIIVLSSHQPVGLPNARRVELAGPAAEPEAVPAALEW